MALDQSLEALDMAVDKDKDKDKDKAIAKARL